jgi:hypothetical protein
MLDELFEEKHKRRPDHYGYGNPQVGYSRDSYDHDDHGHYNIWLNMAKKILRNKVLLIGVGLLVVIICAFAIWLISAILPYLGQIPAMFEKQGIKGVVDMIMPFLQKIWEGTGK